jgi:hypothetical protein
MPKVSPKAKAKKIAEMAKVWLFIILNFTLASSR